MSPREVWSHTGIRTLSAQQGTITTPKPLLQQTVKGTSRDNFNLGWTAFTGE